MWWNQYIGRAFDEKGRGPDAFDCWGLLKWTYAHDHPRRITLPGYEELYESTNDRDTLGRVIFEERKARWCEVEKPVEWDAILLRMRGVPMHVGIVTRPGYMLHCAHGIGTVHEQYDSIRWRSKIMGFFRYE